MRRRTIWIIAIVIVLIVIAGWWFSRPPEEVVETITVTRSDVAQEIDFTAQVEPRDEVKMGFESIGTVAEVLVEVGDIVEAGDVLVRADSVAADLAVAQARANKVSAQDNTLVALQTAEQALADTKSQNARTLEKYRQAVRDTKVEMDQARSNHQTVSDESGDESSTTGTSVSTLRLTEKNYHTAQQVLAEGIKAANKSENAAADAVDSARATYLATKQASLTDGGTAALQAAEDIARVTLSKGVLSAPWRGIVTALSVDPGELLGVATPVITLQTPDDHEIIAEVAETDMAKLSVGQQATVTLDAYGEDEKWPAEVVKIDPAAVFVEGVPTFKVKLRFIETDERFRAGLTADVTVMGEVRKNVVSIPRRLISLRNGDNIVLVQQADGTTEERKVETGLRGSDGTVEVVSGLSEGEVLVRAQDEE